MRDMAKQDRGKSPKRGEDVLASERQALVNMLLADMAKEGPGWTKAWALSAPMNPTTGTVYHGRNAMLLYLCMRVRGLDDPRFMTFNQAKSLGLSVRKGSRSFAIEHWMRPWMRMDPATGVPKRIRPPKDAAERTAYDADPDVFRGMPFCSGHWNVFSACDIEGIEPYVAADGLVGPNEVVDFLEGASPCPVTEAFGDEAYYNRLTDSITIPSRSQFATEEDLARVLLHEQAHATGSPDRLAREKGGRFGDERYAFEELVAELSSMMSANELGIELPSVGVDSEFSRSPYWERHVAYIKNWSSALAADDAGELVLQAASKAGQATTWLMERCFSPALEERVERPRGNESLSLTSARLAPERGGRRPGADNDRRLEEQR